MSFALDTAPHIVALLDELIDEIAPDANRKAMYGGFIFEKQPGVATSGVCGHFIYKAHVSLEFSHGAQMSDEHGLLEGGGKHRRHLKFRTTDDVHDKNAQAYLKQAFAMP